MGDVPTIDALLATRAADQGDVAFLRFSNGDVTFEQAWRRSLGLAHGLRSIGVQRGQLVPVLMPNGEPFAVTWLALAALGAAFGQDA